MNINETLKHYFGYDSLRPGQQELIEGILQRKDVLGIMPTGAGKSLCYQVPALMLDGNKRIGVHAMLVFLALNGYELVYTQAELIDIILSLADGKVEYEELLQWIINHQK